MKTQSGPGLKRAANNPKEQFSYKSTTTSLAAAVKIETTKEVERQSPGEKAKKVTSRD